MRLEKNRQDQMTPAERITSAGEGKMVDRVITIPFMGELKCYLSGISIRDFWFDAEKIAQAERIAFNRWGYDRIVLGRIQEESWKLWVGHLFIRRMESHT